MTTVTEQLVKHIDEAYAMEQNVLRMLDRMIETSEDPAMKQHLQQHKHETEQQAVRLKARLEAHDASPSMVKEATGIVGALMKGVLDMARARRRGGTRETGSPRSTWRSPATSSWSGSQGGPATRRRPRSHG